MSGLVGGSGGDRKFESVQTGGATTETLTFDHSEKYPAYPNAPAGGGVTGLRPHPQANNPVITPSDVTDGSPNGVADPFMLYHNQTYYIFAELIAGGSGNENVIGYWESSDGLGWTYGEIVLDETGDTDYAYPCIVKWGGEIYITPTNGTEDFQVYRATSFPTNWELAETPLTNSELGLGGIIAEPTIFRWNGRWWLSVNDHNNNNDQYLHYTEKTDGGLTGRTWSAHSQNPVMTTADGAGESPRLQGRPMVHDDYIDFWKRPELSLYRVTELTTTSYSQSQLTVSSVVSAEPNGPGNTHHVDVIQSDRTTDIAVLDLNDPDTSTYRLGIYTRTDQSGGIGVKELTSNATVAGDGAYDTLDLDQFHEVAPINSQSPSTGITIAETGYYEISGQVTWTSVASGDVPFESIARIRGGGSSVNASVVQVTESGKASVQLPAKVYYLERLDDVELQVNQDSGGDQTVWGVGSATYLSVKKVW